MQTDQYRQMYQLENSHWWFLSKRKFITLFLPKRTGKQRILDVGCGTGGLTKYLQKYGDVLGVEISQEACKFLQKRKVKFLHLPIDQCDFLPFSFDLIVLGDVLYHSWVKNDEEVLRKIFLWLKRGGHLLVTDSAMNFLSSKHDKKVMARERYYLPALSLKIQTVGFTVEKTSYLFFLLFPFFLISRSVNKFIDFETVGMPNSVLNQMLLLICRLESRLLRYINFPWGSSVIVLAAKP